MESAQALAGGGEVEHAIQMVDAGAAVPASADGGAVEAAAEETGRDEIIPLLSKKDGEKPRLTIFSVSYTPRKEPKEQMTKASDVEVMLLNQFFSWLWSGSRYSGLLCMVVSACIYFMMEVLSDFFSVGSIPLFQIVFTRCAILSVLSFLWLRKTSQPVFGPSHIRKLLFARALSGYLSLLTFIYSFQSLPLSNAIVLNFTTPIMASIVARIMLQEKLTLTDIGGLACSFFGLLFILRPMLVVQGNFSANADPSKASLVRRYHPIYAILVGLFSATTGGISYCLIRAGGKASDQPVVTVFGFALLATPVAAICTLSLEEFVLPNFGMFLLLIVLGVLAFLAEVFTARGLQLEKMSKVANMQYIEALLSQIWYLGVLRAEPSFNRILGCLLILVSICGTLFLGPEKEVNE